jgi:HK97 family phage major capsid protein
MKKKLAELRALMSKLTELRKLETLTDEQKEERKLLVTQITDLNEEVRELKAEEDLLNTLDTSLVDPPEANEGEQRSKIEVGDKPVYRTFGEQLMDIIAVDNHKSSMTEKREAHKRLEESTKRMTARKEVDTFLRDNMEKESRAAGSGQIEGVFSDGGAFVQTDYATDIIEKGFNNSVILPKTQKRTLSGNSNSIEIYGIDETSRAAGSRNGGVVVYTKSELEQYTESKAKFNSIELKVNKLTGLLYLSDEIMEDASFLEGEVSDLFMKEFAFKTQDLIWRGNGAGEPLGILNAAALVTQAKVSGQAADTIVAANISAMKVRASGNAEWYANRDTIPQLDALFKTTGDNSSKIFTQTSINTGLLDGIPITFLEQCDTLGDKGDISLVDFGSYITATKGGVKKAESMHLKFDYGQKAIRWTLRFDGQPRWKSALTPFKGTNTISPYVTLAARA